MYEKTMTANGVLVVSGGRTTRKSTTLHFEGSTGGGVATIGFVNRAGAFVAFETGIVQVGDSRHVQHGLDLELAIELVGGTAPAFEVYAAVGD